MKLIFRIIAATGLLVVCISGCSVDRIALEKEGDLIVLLNSEFALDGQWEHRRLRRSDTEYVHVETGLGHTIRATGNQSASILYRLFEPVSLNCDRMRWNWFVQETQPGSDLRVKGRDDVAAAVFVMFGDAGLFQDKPVPTLKYVWANKQHQKGDIIAGPYHKEFIRSIVLQNGNAVEQKLVTENVNLKQDYVKAFGVEPKEDIYGVAIFTDNDDTREPIVAHYGKIELLCRE